MSARQDLFTFLDKKPDAPLDEVLGKFSGVKESTIRRYYFEYQKSEKPAKTPKKKTPGSAIPSKASGKKVAHKSVKEQVADFMQQYPESEAKELNAAFPDLNKNTLSNYRRQWLKENPPSSQELSKSKQNEIFSFLDNNPYSNINDLKKVFPEVANKLVTVFRSWKSARISAPEIASEEKRDQSPKEKTSKTKEVAKTAQSWLEKHKETIEKQKEIIEKQKTRIEALKSQLPTVKRPRFFDRFKKFITDKLSN